MELIILGYSGGYPEPGGATSGYFLQLDCGKNILIDCGSGVLSNLFQIASPENIDAIFISHLHYDHMTDLPVMKYAVEIQRNAGKVIPAIPVFTPRTPQPQLDSILFDGGFHLHYWDEREEISLFGTSVRVLRTIHPVESYAILVRENGRQFAYTSDTLPDASLTGFIQGSDFAVMDAGSTETEEAGKRKHMTAMECARTALEAGIGTLMISHLPPACDKETAGAEARMIFKNTILPELFIRIRI